MVPLSGASGQFAPDSGVPATNVVGRVTGPPGLEKVPGVMVNHTAQPAGLVELTEAATFDQSPGRTLIALNDAETFAPGCWWGLLLGASFPVATPGGVTHRGVFL